MYILALETTATAGSVAASDGTNLLLELDLDPRQRSAQSLAPAIERLLAQVEWKPNSVDLVAVTVGPGSFTGLRVGVTMAKTFAYAVGAAILGIDTLQTIAAGVENLSGQSIHSLHVAVDAQRGDLVVQSFALTREGWFLPRGDQQLLPAERWLKELAPGSVITGPVLGNLHLPIPDALTVLPEPLWHPRARHVARLAARDYAAGRRSDLWQLVPRYARRSAAEEKWDAARILFPGM